MKRYKIFRGIFFKVFFNVVDEHDPAEYNLETEDGFNLLQEDGSLIKL